ncbi:MAG: NAD(P)/FAD-dependent oxidoreductase [Promethearchaeota archaeon]
MYDVLISGAGPSGNKCAEVLARAGFKVALLERNCKWRKPCGGAVSARIMQKYYPQLRKFNFLRITGASLFSANYQELEYNWGQRGTDSLIVDRLEFDNFLRKVAVDAGATLHDNNYSFDFIYKEKKRIGVKTKTPSGTREYRAKIIIIADGMSSKLAMRSGLRGKWDREEIGMAKCSILEGPNILDKNKMYLYFRAYKGYGWIFPQSKTRVNIGCGTFEEDNLRHDLNQIYTEFMNDPHVKHFFPAENYKNIWSGAYPLPARGVKEHCLYGDGLMIVGDAAGFVSPISGEGIHAAIVSGQIAGETAVQALGADDTSKKMLKSYKTHPNIKKIIRNFKLKHSMVEFFYENKGINLNSMFSLAEKDEDFRNQVINMFFFNLTPSKEFFERIRNFNQEIRDVFHES